jgi:hypothetical protein
VADEKRQLILDLLARAKTKKGTDEAAADIDKFGRAAEDADKKTEKLGKTSEKTSQQADKLGNGLETTKKRISGLDKEIELVGKELSSLAGSFADAGSAGEKLDISKAIRKSQGELRRLNTSKGLLSDLLPDPEPEAKGWIKRLGGALTGGVASLGETIASNKYLAAGIGAGVVTLGPMIGGLIGAAVVGGVGIGGIIGGIALAAKSDAAVQQYAGAIGKNFTSRVQAEARGAFSGIIMKDLGKVESLANKAVGGIGKAFKSLAPSVDPMVDSFIRAGEVLGKSFLGAAEKAGPVLKAVGRFAETTAESLGGFVDMLAANSETAADALDDFGAVVKGLVSVVSFTVEQLLTFRLALSQVGDAVQSGKGWLEDHVGWLDLTADGYKKGSEAAELYRQGIIGAAGSANDYDHYLAGAVESTDKLRDSHADAAAAADAQKKAEQDLTAQIRGQVDPAFALLNAIDGVREAKKAAAEATHKYGSESNQARDATRKLAEAAINLQGAAGAAGGGLDGKMSPALRRTLEAAKLTKSQIASVERELRSAKSAADAYSGTYKATIQTTYVKYYTESYKRGGGSSRYPDERAAGGPIVRGKPYLVGENGPEIVVPDASGRVLNSSASRGLMVQAGMTGQQGTMAAASGGGGGAYARVEVSGSADQAVATLINYLIRTGKLNVMVGA